MKTTKTIMPVRTSSTREPVPSFSVQKRLSESFFLKGSLLCRKMRVYFQCRIYRRSKCPNLNKNVIFSTEKAMQIPKNKVQKI